MTTGKANPRCVTYRADEKSLKEYGIETGGITLHLVLALRGGRR